MPEISKKIISANNVKNGSAVATCTVKGEFDTVNPKINKAPSIDAMNTKYGEKFDDPTYYSA